MANTAWILASNRREPPLAPLSSNPHQYLMLSDSPPPFLLLYLCHSNRCNRCVVLSHVI